MPGTGWKPRLIVLSPNDSEKPRYGSRLASRDVASYGRKCTGESSIGMTAQCSDCNAYAALKSVIDLIA